MKPLDIAIVSDTQPGNTGSGGSVAVYGLKNLLTRLGHKVTFFMPSYFMATGAPSENIRVFETDFQNHKMDLVWLFNLRTWKYFRPFARSHRFVLYCLEPLHRIASLRLRFKSKYDQSRNPYKYFLEWLNIERVRLQEIAYIREVSQQGVLTTFAPNVHDLWQKYSSQKITVCPLPYPDFGLRKNRYGSNDGAGLLLGNMNGIHTRYGLDFFFEKIWARANSPSNKAMPVLHVVGGGEMPATFPKPREDQSLKWVGFVPDLESEWEQAKYLLVPVPVADGVRSRIIEAWCRGVPVIAHPAAEKGLPMMQPGINYISAESPAAWVAEMSRRREIADFENLIVGGRDAYERHFSVDALSPVYQDVINRAMN
ncbi:MAG: glycosyltransferase [Anaerolineales bacterium]